jgi:glucose-6-phosphate dehydrogenase assembly protein OpcA
VTGPAPQGAAAPLIGEEFILLGPRGSRPFDAVDLEAEVRSMWRSASTEGPAQGQAVYRAALANLVVPLDVPGLKVLSSVLVEVTRRHPSRLFLIETASGAPAGPLRARVTALCHLRAGGGGAVCSEQIVLQPGPGAEPLVPSAVRSLLVGELPVVLLDVHPGAPAPWREELWRAADLSLGDSALHGDPEAAVPLWDRIVREGTSRIHDLAWARLTPWREILAELFDEPPLGASLETLEEVELYQGTGAGTGPSAPALLLAGWLSARLRWIPERKEDGSLRLRGGRGPVRFHFRRDAEDETRSISRVRMRGAAPHPLSVEIVRHGRDPRAAVRIDEPLTSRREVSFHYREFASCIVGEIHRHEPNPALLEAVSSAQALRRAWAGAA